MLTRAGKFTVEHIPVPHPAGSVDLSKPPVGVLHTTEGSFESALAVFRQHFGPNFLVGRDRTGKVRIVQLVPLGTMTAALENPSGGVETNRWTRAQIELVGFSKETPWLPDREVLEALASLMAELAVVAGIPLKRPFEDKMPSPPWATPSFSRRHAGKWGRVAGWYGHVEVPENRHWDPGALEWTPLLSRARELLAPAPTPTPAPTPEEDEITKQRVLELETAAEKFDAGGRAAGTGPRGLTDAENAIFYGFLRQKDRGVREAAPEVADLRAKIAKAQADLA